MFFFKKKHASSDVIKFLENADDAYMLAYTSKDVRSFEPYCTAKVLREVTEDVMSGKEVYFGLKKYMHRSWCLVKEDDIIKVYFKDVTHDNIEVIHKIAIPVGDRVSEEWTLEPSGKSYVVTEIRRRS